MPLSDAVKFVMGISRLVDVAGTLVGDGVAVADGRTVPCAAGVGVADLVGLAREVGRGLAGDRDGLGLGEATGCTVARAWPLELACGGTIA